MSKTKRILEYLQSGKELSQLDATYIFRTTRLGSIIFELRKKYDIETEIVRDGSDSYAIYRYKGVLNEN